MQIDFLTYDHLRRFLFRYWLQLAVSVLALTVVLRKDLSFKVSIQAPIDTQVTTTLPNGKKQTAKNNAPFAEASLTPLGVGKAYSDGLSAAAKSSFVQRFLGIAQQEAKKYKIPTAIILAQALLNTQAGTNPLAIKANNFFKLRNDNAWHGKTYKAKTGIYRAYPSAWAAFRDHSLYITSGKFAHTASLGSTDYKGWAAALEQGGYSTQDNYAAALIGIIESNGLAQYDE